MQTASVYSCSSHGEVAPAFPAANSISLPSSTSFPDWKSPGGSRLLHGFRENAWCNRARTYQGQPLRTLQVTCNLATAWNSLPPAGKIVAAGVGALCVYLVGKTAMAKSSGKQIGDAVGGRGMELSDAVGGGSHVQMIVKGATSFEDHVGPWAVQDLALGLAAMAKVSEKEPPPPPGRPVEDLSGNSQFLACAQHWRALAEAAYVCDAASFSLQTQLPESALVHAEWNADQKTLRPAYCVCVDGTYGAVVLSVRGTSHVVDMLVDSGAAAESFCGGQAHAGYVHGTELLLKAARPHLMKAFQQVPKETKLVIVGHSMGASIGVMAGFKLREEYPGLQCWCFSPPASLSRDLAVESAQFAISIMSAYDIVPRFSIASVEKLRQQLLDFDWDNAKRVLQGDPDWDKLKGAVDAAQKFQDKAGESAEGVKQKLPLNQEEEKPGDGSSSEEKKKKPPPALYPPGRLLILASDPPGCGKVPESRSNVADQRSFGAYPSFEQSLMTKWALHEARHEEFLEMVVTPWGVSDHMLGNLCEGIGFLQRQCPPSLSCPSNLLYA